MRILSGFNLLNPAWLAQNVFTLYGGKGDAPAAPDYTPIAASNAEAAKYAYDAADKDLAFRKQQYADSVPYQKQLYDLASQVAQQQLGLGNLSQQQAQQQLDSYNSTYRPVEMQTVLDSLGSQYLSEDDVKKAIGYLSSPDNTEDQTAGINELANKAQEGAATRAGAGLQAQVNNAVDQQTRSLSRMGLNSGRLQANLAATAQQQALANTGAQNQARTQTADKQIALRSGVANFGRNMPNTAGQAIGTSANTGSQAVGNQNTGFQSGLAYPQYVSGGTANQLGAAGLQQQGALGLGGLMNQGYATSANIYNNQGSFLGGALGLAGSLGSAAILKPKSTV